MRLGRMALGRLQPLTADTGPAPDGVPVSFSKLLKPRAEGLKPNVDLPPTGWQGPRLPVHAFQHAYGTGHGKSISQA